MKLVLIGDGESPHLLKWARALAPRVQLWAVSSRGFLPGFDAVLSPDRRLALNTRPNFEGGNAALLKQLPRVGGWLKTVQADWLHAHYLTSHGTLAWLSQRVYRVPGRLVSTAWGSDILVAPEHSRTLRWLTRRVLASSALATSDSRHMAQRMQALGAREVMVVPFGLEAMPALPAQKDDDLFFTNRGLEPIYDPLRVLSVFAGIAAHRPAARLVVANDGSMRPALEQQVQALGLVERVRFTGRLEAAEQDRCYAQARWYLSLPRSDAVSVSVLEAMGHGCIPLLSDLPANRELVLHGDNGWIVTDDVMLPLAIDRLRPHGARIARRNHDWVRDHGLFAPQVDRFLARLQQLAA